MEPDGKCSSHKQSCEQQSQEKLIKINSPNNSNSSLQNHTKIQLFDQQDAAEQYIKSLYPTPSFILRVDNVQLTGIDNTTDYLCEIMEKKQHGAVITKFLDYEEDKELAHIIEQLKTSENNNNRLNYVVRKPKGRILYEKQHSNNANSNMMLIKVVDQLGGQKHEVPDELWKFARCWNCQSTINLYLRTKDALEGNCPICNYDGLNLAAIEEKLVKNPSNADASRVIDIYMTYLKRRIRTKNPFRSRSLFLPKGNRVVQQAGEAFLRVLLKKRRVPIVPVKKWIVYLK